ncbi:MAG: UDP-or dTTP-glucose 4-epimerase or 4-6-dehydratase [Candidatus Gottesmanbacteria bacterium GW2011_GWA1_34_13]|uniref:UDP-glucuronate decarboxylase n=1 Tax=Candidatus Gottesmanbacteria bacterium GW2011_GWA1_34_13 TaxID=1618434 RepID=A0A0G0D8T8_9BACT|nr:MAG: UDP-or dTTP-glucose 4-epimerase or 4-6-dehydratase [Candidatus Gottesmanbacteria bacterium GW2011_GWA1_34_13]
MKCLVTGGAGFIGSHLCENLLNDEHEVYCLDNLITGSLDNISHLTNNSRFTFINHDCSKILPELPKFDYIFHFASPASPPKYQQYALETLLVNTYGTYLLLEKIRREKGIFIFASTSEIYGDPEEHPQKEKYWGKVNPVGIRSCYDEAKRLGETLITVYKNKFGIDGRIIRIFNTYGPRMSLDDGRIITNLIGQIKRNLPLTVYGNGSQTRSFCYISDLIIGIKLIAFDKKGKNQIFNLGNPEEISILETVNLMKKIINYQGEISYKELPEDDPAKRCPDISKIQKILGWCPKITLSEGLKKTWDSFN